MGERASGSGLGAKLTFSLRAWSCEDSTSGAGRSWRNGEASMVGRSRRIEVVDSLMDRTREVRADTELELSTYSPDRLRDPDEESLVVWIESTRWTVDG